MIEIDPIFLWKFFNANANESMDGFTLKYLSSGVMELMKKPHRRTTIAWPFDFLTLHLGEKEKLKEGVLLQYSMIL